MNPASHHPTTKHRNWSRRDADRLTRKPGRPSPLGDTLAAMRATTSVSTQGGFRRQLGATNVTPHHRTEVAAPDTQNATEVTRASRREETSVPGGGETPSPDGRIQPRPGVATELLRRIRCVVGLTIQRRIEHTPAS